MIYHRLMHYDTNYSLLIELQKVDSEIDGIEEKLRELPLEIEECEKRIEDFRKKLIGLDEELKKKELLLREKEAEYKSEEDTLATYKRQLLQIKNNDEYRAMLQQIDNQKKKIRNIEDEILKLEEEFEDFKKALPALKQEVEEEIKQEEAKKRELIEMKDVLVRKKSALEAKREELENKIQISALRKYERLRKKGYRDVIVSIEKIMGNEGEEYVCSACNSTVPLEIYLKVKRGEAFVRCENCGRFLYYEEKEEA